MVQVGDVGYGNVLRAVAARFASIFSTSLSQPALGVKMAGVRNVPRCSVYFAPCLPFHEVYRRSGSSPRSNASTTCGGPAHSTRAFSSLLSQFVLKDSMPLVRETDVLVALRCHKRC